MPTGSQRGRDAEEQRERGWAELWEPWPWHARLATLAIPLFGTASVLSFLAPERGLRALLSVALLALTLALRLRTARACANTMVKIDADTAR